MMRSLLFVPGDSERKLARALDAGADTLILDLEDAVAPERKAAARELVVAFLQGRNPQQRTRLWVRINALDTPAARADLAALAGHLPDGIVIPKIEDQSALLRLSDEITQLEVRGGAAAGQVRFMPIIETPRGVLLAPGFLAASIPRLVALTWGAEDLSTALGMRSRANDRAGALQAARAQCLLVAASLGIAAIETVTTNIKDLDALRHGCLEARAEGFGGKLAIHPAQVPVINAAFAPSDTDLEWAHRVVAAFAAGHGAAMLDGQMIDIVHLRHARRLLAPTAS